MLHSMDGPNHLASPCRPLAWFSLQGRCLCSYTTCREEFSFPFLEVGYGKDEGVEGKTEVNGKALEGSTHEKVTLGSLI